MRNFMVGISISFIWILLTFFGAWIIGSLGTPWNILSPGSGSTMNLAIWFFLVGSPLSQVLHLLKYSNKLRTESQSAANLWFGALAFNLTLVLGTYIWLSW